MENRKLVQRKCVAETIFKNKKGFEVKIFSDFGYGYYKYMNPLKKDILEIKDFNEFIKEIAYWEGSTGRGKKKRRYGVLKCTNNKKWGEEIQVRIFEDEFISCKSEIILKEVDLKNTTIGRISKDLNAEEFLAFLKDNNISYPLIK